MSSAALLYSGGSNSVSQLALRIAPARWSATVLSVIQGKNSKNNYIFALVLDADNADVSY